VIFLQDSIQCKFNTVYISRLPR